jgi:hypothetical protein
VLAATCLLAVSSIAHAISPAADDFEGYGTDGVPSVPFFNPPWLGFSDNGGFPGGYSFDASTSGPQISALAYNGVDNQYINFYANYDNVAVHGSRTPGPGSCQAGPSGCSPNSQEEIALYREFTFFPGEAAAEDTWVFSFDYREADSPFNPSGFTEVGAFIKVFDLSFNLLKEVTLDTSGLQTWREGRLLITLDPAWVNGGKIQIGFFNLTGFYDNSGMYYDNVNFVQAQETPIDLTRNTIHPHHDGKCFNFGCFPDDVNTVIVFGQDTGVGDPNNLNAANILPETLRFGPGLAPESPFYTPEFPDKDSDGLTDGRFRFQQSATGFDQNKITCSDSSATLTGRLSTGETFVGTDTFTSNCDAVCHTGDFDLP